MKRDTSKYRNQIPPGNTACRTQFHRHDPMHLITRLNQLMDAHHVPTDINEPLIENIMVQWEQNGKCHLPGYWLLAARLFEMSVLSAGHYVDNCEFRAAGDLLYNPRKILIYRKDSRNPVVKRRHGRLSDQLKGYKDRPANERFSVWCTHQVATQITRPAILPHLFGCLKQSGWISTEYLQMAQCRLQKASQAIGFLCSWSICNAQDLHVKMVSASPESRQFIHHHLCLFDTALFDTLGKEIDRLGEDPKFRSAFITYPTILDATSTKLPYY